MLQFLRKSGSSIRVARKIQRPYHSASVLLQSSLQENPSLRKAAFRERWQEETQKALLGGGQARIDKQHAKGRLTARERIDILFDEGTFQELDQLKSHRCVEFGMNAPDKQFPGDGIVTG